MDIQQLLDQLPHQLRQRGLPEEYIARYVDELQEHITDLIEERTSPMSKDARIDDEVVTRIGAPLTLADAASIEFGRRSFCGRHPMIMFLVVPIPLAFIAWIATFATLFGCGAGTAMVAQWLGKAPSLDSMANWSTAAILAMTILFWLCVVGPPAALNVLLCRLAGRHSVNWRWSLAGCVMVAVAAGLFRAGLEPAVTAGGHGRMVLGFGLWLFPPLQQWLQFAFPLLIGVGFLWRQTRQLAGSAVVLANSTGVNRQAA